MIDTPKFYKCDTSLHDLDLTYDENGSFEHLFFFWGGGGGGLCICVCVCVRKRERECACLLARVCALACLLACLRVCVCVCVIYIYIERERGLVAEQVYRKALLVCYNLVAMASQRCLFVFRCPRHTPSRPGWRRSRQGHTVRCVSCVRTVCRTVWTGCVGRRTTLV